MPLPVQPLSAPSDIALEARAPATDPIPSTHHRSNKPTIGLLERFVVSGNWLVRSGIIVLFAGVGFLLKFAAEHSLLPLELRLAGVGIAGFALVILGLRLAASRRAYALALQGGGVGLVYLDLYAAFALYGLLSAPVALSMMLLAVLVAGCLAHRQDAQVLAVMGAIGGFAAPVLVSTGAGSHVLLFAYYALLNLGVLGLALLNTWRWLNLSGFVATFVLSASWGYKFYRARDRVRDRRDPSRARCALEQRELGPGRRSLALGRLASTATLCAGGRCLVVVHRHKCSLS